MADSEAFHQRAILPVPHRKRTQPILFSQDETTDVGFETGTPVSSEYGLADSRFTGSVNWVRLQAGLDGNDHLIDPEDLVKVAMIRQ